jgi:mannan endo-1,4-beta-mannosidase
MGKHGTRIRHRRRRGFAAIIASIGLAIAVAVGVLVSQAPLQPTEGATLPTTPDSYLGVYVNGFPRSYSVVDSFAAPTGVRPNLALYYIGWGEQFQAGFARQAARRGAVPLIQMDPENVKVAGIAAGWYDKYLISYARAVRAYGDPVILSFGHEMNGWWYSWGHGHTSPADFVAAWRHIVTVFRLMRTKNVTWLWTINIVGKRRGIPDPGPWWPGSPYVTWIGIDGYYHKRSWTFASLFGPTIKVVHMLTRRPIPILIAETGAAPRTGQPDKIADLFKGIRSYGLLGFVWFDAKKWRLHGRAAANAFRHEARSHRVAPSLAAVAGRPGI